MINTHRMSKVFMLIALGVCLVVASYLPVLRKARTDEFFARATIESAGGATNVLVNCRHMIYCRAKAEQLSQPEISVEDPAVPVVIRRMNPNYIVVRPNFVVVRFDAPGRRSGFIVFREGAEQFGTALITNGIWYWNGTPSRGTTAAYNKNYHW